MGLFRKGKTGIIPNIHRTDLVICSHSREGKTLFCSQINTIVISCCFSSSSFFVGEGGGGEGLSMGGGWGVGGGKRGGGKSDRHSIFVCFLSQNIDNFVHLNFRC